MGLAILDKKREVILLESYLINKDTSTVKCAILGCRGRARAHANAYQDIERGYLAAICDMNVERLNEFGQMFNVDQRYTDIHQMLEKEKPDLLHIVTAPISTRNKRVNSISTAQDCRRPPGAWRHH